MKKIYCLLLLTSSIFYSSCKKEKPDVGTETGEAAEYTISNSAVLPMQMVVITSSQNISDEAKIATIDGTSVNLIKVNDKEWNFSCPVLEPGKHKVYLENTFDLEFTIKNYTTIQNPDVQINNLKDNVEKFNAEIISSDILDKQNLSNELIYYKNALEEMKAKLSEKEKLELAYYIQSNGINKIDFTTLTNTEIPDSFYMNKKGDDGTDATNKFIISYTTAKINAVIFIGTTVAFLLAPDPTFLTKGLAAVSGIAAVMNIAVMKKLIENDLSKLLAKAISFEGFLKRSIQLDFKVDQPLEISLNGTWGNIVNNDNSKGIFPELFSGVEEINNKIQQLYDCYEKAKAFFTTPQPTEKKTVLKVGNTQNQKQMGMNLNYVKIKSISNPDIKVSMINNENYLSLIATAENITEKINFTITLEYSQENINNTIEKTFNASIDSMDDKLYLLEASNKILTNPINFNSGETKSFVLSKDQQTAATDIDYSQVSVIDISTPKKTQLDVNYKAESFTIKLTNNEEQIENAKLEVSYKGSKIETMNATVEQKVYDSTGWFVGEYELLVGSNGSVCSPQVGQKGKVYFYVYKYGRSFRYVTLIKSIISALDDRYVMIRYNEFQFDKFSNCAWIGQMAFSEKGLTQVLKGFINTSKQNEVGCDGKMGGVKFSYDVATSANYFGMKPPSQLTQQEIDTIMDWSK